MLRTIRARWDQGADAAGLAVFRIIFGLTMMVGALRFLANGWVDRFFVQPNYYFDYWGLDWIGVASPVVMHVAVLVLALLGGAIALGMFTRFSLIAFFGLFTYVELIDVTNYLNHYVFVSMLTMVLAFTPCGAKWSFDAWRAGRPTERISMFWYDWLRLQVGAVWVSAAIAKMTPDWLFAAQPMNIWLNARVDTPLIGPLLDIWEVALVASWAGLLYDLSIPFLLLWRRTRRVAFVAVLGFHLMTHVWFAIGMFPVIMVGAATIFFDPSWPRRVAERFRGFAPAVVPRMGGLLPQRAVRAFAIVWCAALMVLPVRFLAYGGDILWHEQGMRWAFKVMCREKNGSVTYRVVLPSQGREVLFVPGQWLTPHQQREMSGQPDMILSLAHDVAGHYRARGHHDVQVYVDAIASLNGRPAAALIDPRVDLAATEDSLLAASWILPAPVTPAPRIGRSLFAAPQKVASQ